MAWETITTRTVERAIEQHYKHVVILPKDLKAQVRAGVENAITEHFELSDELRQQFTKQLDKLDKKESYFLDLAAEEGWPKDKLRAKLTAIREEQQQITRQLDQATNQLDIGRQIFLTALDLLDNPYELYQTGNETVRSILNRTFFPRLYIDGHKVTGYELNEPFECSVRRTPSTGSSKLSGRVNVAPATAASVTARAKGKSLACTTAGAVQLAS